MGAPLHELWRVHKKALRLCVFFVLSLVLCVTSARAATLPGTTLTNTATANYQIAGTPFTLSATAKVVTDATIQFMAPMPGGTATPVGASQCASSGSTGGPFNLNGGIAAGSQTLSPVAAYNSGQTLYVEVTDQWANKNPALVETIAVTITNGAVPSDTETLLLTETGPNTGVFTGAIATTLAPAVSNNCVLSVVADTRINATYTYNHNGSATATTASTAAMIDPFGTVFDSGNGMTENGATVTLVDTSTGLPATVLCDNGVQISPNPVVSGSTFTACGGTVVLPPGGYRFPRIGAGNYQLQVQPASGYRFASTISPAALTANPATATYAVSTASYGAQFTVGPASPALRIDIPVDPSGRNLQITKVAGKSVVGEGEYVPYTLTIDNESATASAVNVQIADRLPQGFRYQSGSARLNGAVLVANPSISPDGRTLTFNLGDIPASGSDTLAYVIMVTAGAQTGKAENIAQSAPGNPLTSNVARASIMVREDLMRSRAILMGRVIVGSCDGHVDNEQDGLQNARIVLEDGTYILTDKDGRWHADNIRPGTHVVQLDLDSLTQDYEVVACEQNSRFAGRNYSQFVNVRGGSLWRADFHVQRKIAKEMHLTQHLAAVREGDLIRMKLQVYGDGDIRLASSTFMLPGDAHLVADSARLDGQATNALEINDGFLVLRLGAQQGAWNHTLTFDLKAGPAAVNLVAMARFVSTSASQGINLPRAEILVDTQPAEVENFAIIPPVVPHHESPNIPGAQDLGVRTMRVDGITVPQPDNADNRTQLVEQLPYDAAWLAAAEPGTEWLHPQESFLPALPAIKVALKMAPGQRAKLMLNGEEVSPLYYDGAETNAARTVMLATWRGIHIKDGDNKLEMIVTDASGHEVLRQVRNIRYTIAPDRVELVPDRSRLIADGKTRPILALRFFDKDGYMMRRGVNGEFMLNSPYQSISQIEAIQRDPLGGKIDGKARYEIGSDGIALVQLAPTTQTGDVALNFKFDNGHTQELHTWLEPGQRDWILVGFGQGTLGHKQLSGNMEALSGAGADSQLFDGDRAAFYAKGTIKGEYLLTMAYDTAKSQGNSGANLTNLTQAINPTQYYTLYADATAPYFDAASTSKLYLKIERKQFYALFGDFNTGLTVTEFSRYSRSVNGVKSEYKGEKFGYNAFATRTSHAYVKDEIPGDGTSGLYRLTRTNILANSDKIRVEIRDRFQSQIIVSTQTMTRYLDYDIDYQNGTVFFKQPITARDAAFNPVYIVAEYESGDPRDQSFTGGGRASVKPGGGVEIGTTLISDGTQGANGKLGGLDATWQINKKTKVQAEAASSNQSNLGLKVSGSARKVELSSHDESLDTKVYVRDQEAGFGLGQQAISETGTRKVGGEARLKLSDANMGQFQAYREQNLGIVTTRRDVVDARVNYMAGSLATYYGGRHAGDVDSMGNTRISDQVLGGASYRFDKKLTLRADAEAGLGNSSNTDFPNRLKLGADYQLTEQTKAFAEQEYARSNMLNTEMTRVGLSTQPWTGAAMRASLGNQYSLDSGRVYANLGLVQKWQINEFWQSDFGVDRSKTVRSSNAVNGPLPLNPNVPPASGSLTGDYIATSAGVNYNDKVWGANCRIERRTSATDDKINLLFGFQHNLDGGRVFASGLSYIATHSAILTSDNFDARVSYASRPWDSTWAMLERFDYIEQLTTGIGSFGQARKLVNNYNANWMPKSSTQVALQYGAKYVFDNIGGIAYGGYTDLMGIELRHDLGQSWDIGAHADLLHTWSARTMSYGFGVSLGYKLVDNAWMVAGYNFLGFRDGDFIGSEYRSKGIYITLRFKVDQDTLHLNDRKNEPITHNF